MKLEEKINECIKTQTPVKLHVGCGPNILEGYINIEGEYLKDQPNTFFHDITEKFPINDNLVEEILHVHVIEHILPSDIPNSMLEWIRILKPGGRLCIEWPDLLKACKFLVDDPSRIYSDNRKIRKRGISAIFGNIQRYKDPVMLHKWGYSAESMIKLLESYGFVNVRQEPNLYPKTDNCSRVVGIKP